MSPGSLPSIPLLLLSLLPLILAGGTTSPDDFDPECVAAASFPESQQILANLDFYDQMTDTSTFTLTGWTGVDGECDLTLTVCSGDVDSASNQVQVHSINEEFYDDGANDPVYLETSFSCASCPDCSLRVTTTSGTVTENVIYPCSGVERAETLTIQRGDISFTYEAIFTNLMSTECVTITQYRAYQYADCPAQTIDLAEYPQSDPGIGPSTATRCVVNAEAQDPPVLAGCNNTSQWEVLVGSGECLCSAGYEPNPSLTMCNACAEGFFKSSAGNDACELCGNNEVSTADRTECECMPNYAGDNCDQCVADYFMPAGSSCTACPSGSARPLEASDMSLCTCTGNLVTSATNSPTTNNPSVGCDTCAEGYYRGSDEDTAAPCDLCDTDFFMSGGSCLACPAGSSRQTNDDSGSCGCNGGMVTSGGSISTSDVPCDNCMADMVLVGGVCQSCPESSTRDLSDNPDECVCVGNTVTASGSSTTTTDDCTDCMADMVLVDGVCQSCPESSTRDLSDRPDECVCVGNTVTASGSSTTTTDDCTDCAENYSRASEDDQCSVIMVRFSETAYTFREDENITLSISAAPPPTNDITIIVSSSSSEVADIEKTLTQAEPMGDVVIPPFNDDDIALQRPRNYTFTFSTDSGVDQTADVQITDDDEVRAEFEQTSYSLEEDAGLGEVCVSLSNPAAIPVRVQVEGETVTSVTVESPSAPALGELSQELEFPVGQTTQCVSVNVNDDSEVEDADEHYRLSLRTLSPDDNDAFTVGEDTFVFIEDDDDDSSVTSTESPSSQSERSESDSTLAIVGGVVAGAVFFITSAVTAIVIVVLVLRKCTQTEKRHAGNEVYIQATTNAAYELSKFQEETIIDAGNEVYIQATTNAAYELAKFHEEIITQRHEYEDPDDIPTTSNQNEAYHVARQAGGSLGDYEIPQTPPPSAAPPS